MNVGSKIKQLRIQRNMTQKELGEKLGVSQQHIAQYENEKRTPKLATLQKIAIALDVNVNNILEEALLEDSPVYRAFVKSGDTESPLFLDIKNSHLTEEIEHWKPIDIELVKMFKTLNDAGQAKAIERVEELTEIPRYTQKEENPSDG